MTGLNRRAGKVGLGLAVAFAVLVSCTEDPTGSGGGVSGNISDPAAFEAYIQQKFLPGFLGVVDGIQRLIVAADGGTQDGVTITPTGTNSFAATVAMDLNADGTRETTLSGGASGDITTDYSAAELNELILAAERITDRRSLKSPNLVLISPESDIFAENCRRSVGARERPKLQK